MNISDVFKILKKGTDKEKKKLLKYMEFSEWNNEKKNLEEELLLEKNVKEIISIKNQWALQMISIIMENKFPSDDYVIMFMEAYHGKYKDFKEIIYNLFCLSVEILYQISEKDDKYTRMDYFISCIFFFCSDWPQIKKETYKVFKKIDKKSIKLFKEPFLSSKLKFYDEKFKSKIIKNPGAWKEGYRDYYEK